MKDRFWKEVDSEHGIKQTNLEYFPFVYGEVIDPDTIHYERGNHMLHKEKRSIENSGLIWIWFALLLLLVYVLIFWNIVSICSWYWPWTHDPLAFIFWVLELQACITMVCRKLHSYDSHIMFCATLGKPLISDIILLNVPLGMGRGLRVMVHLS